MFGWTKRQIWAYVCLIVLIIVWNSGIFWWSTLIKNHEAISTFGPLLIGIVGLVGLPFLYKRTRATEQQAKAALDQTEAIFRQVAVAEQGHVTDRFTKAIEQLGSDNLAVRLGGIYALERIAKDSKRDHWTIMEVLTAYVRQNAPWPSKVFNETSIIKGSPSKTETDSEQQEKVAENYLAIYKPFLRSLVAGQ